jgi:hypothetical protein
MALLLAIGFLIPGIVRAQVTVPVDDIFSGTVTQLTDRSLKVVRKVPGQPPVTREFTRDASTSVEGKLRNKARVTVRYRVGEDGGFVAVHIIVR